MKNRVINKSGFLIGILYEDDNVIVVDKPSGLVVYKPNINSSEISLREIFSNKLAQDDPIRGGIVHRLDKYTSGVMILAKNEEVLNYLKKQFINRSVEKIYKALVWAHPKHSRAKIELPLARSFNKPNKVSVRSGGKMSISDYSAMASYEQFSLLEVRIHTGRMHQIRAQFSHIGYPVVGDRLYSNRPIPKELKRQFLHSESLSISIPGNKQKKVFKSELPSDLTKFLNELK